ncbi:MAG: NfeD family protein [Candidatus Omnitrophica bacterium]|nr:NfeD family protein [Candidatus Omnitrophota bacterium]
MLFYILLFLFVGLVLVFLELFVPGGVIGFMGVCLMGLAVYLCFKEYGYNTGIAMFLLCCFITLGAVVMGFKYLPHTRIGGSFILKHAENKDKGFHTDAYENLNLTGMEGIAESELRPAGIAMIGQNRYDVVTEGEFLRPQTRIRVIRVDGNRIVVERA